MGQPRQRYGRVLLAEPNQVLFVALVPRKTRGPFLLDKSGPIVLIYGPLGPIEPHKVVVWASFYGLEPGPVVHIRRIT